MKTTLPPDARFCLEMLVMETGWMASEELAELISMDNIIGAPNTKGHGPVGLWLINEMNRYGFSAQRYAWHGLTLRIYGNDEALGEIEVPEGHTLHILECEVNDLEHPELCVNGEGGQR